MVCDNTTTSNDWSAKAGQAGFRSPWITSTPRSTQAITLSTSISRRSPTRRACPVRPEARRRRSPDPAHGRRGNVVGDFCRSLRRLMRPPPWLHCSGRRASGAHTGRRSSKRRRGRGWIRFRRKTPGAWRRSAPLTISFERAGEAPVGGEQATRKSCALAWPSAAVIAGKRLSRVEVIQRLGHQQIGVGVKIIGELVALIAQIGIRFRIPHRSHSGIRRFQHAGQIWRPCRRRSDR